MPRHRVLWSMPSPIRCRRPSGKPSRCFDAKAPLGGILVPPGQQRACETSEFGGQVEEFYSAVAECKCGGRQTNSAHFERWQGVGLITCPGPREGGREGSQWSFLDSGDPLRYRRPHGRYSAWGGLGNICAKQQAAKLSAKVHGGRGQVACQNSVCFATLQQFHDAVPPSPRVRDSASNALVLSIQLGSDLRRTGAQHPTWH